MSPEPLPPALLRKVDYHSKRIGLALRLALEEFVCKGRARIGCIELFFTNPRLFKDLLLEYYEGSIESVKFIVKEMIIIPVFMVLGENPYGKEEELSDLFIENPERARDEMAELLRKVK
ncbi:MAG: hypothetical protein QXP68_03865 [Thermosphaera sp.]